MNGFFEHQYLSYKKKHMMNLIVLARSDGHFHEKELEILYKIGKKYELKSRHIEALLVSEVVLQANIPGNHDQSLEQLYDLVDMMLADGITQKSELEFCRHMIVSLGYKAELLEKLVAFVESEVFDQEKWNVFKKESLVFKNVLVH